MTDVRSADERSADERSADERSAQCLACGAAELRHLLDADDVPALVGALWPSEAAAREVRTGRMELACCTACSHVSNIAFDGGLVSYDAGYDNSLHYSPTFQRYAEQLAARLLRDHDLRGRTILEIGSGKGEFLRLLCAGGRNRGLGYDPTYSGESDSDGVTFVRGLYPLDGTGEAFDLVVARHVLEHLERPYDLLAGLRRAAGDREVGVYLEVPNGEFTMSPAGQWDLIYPHVSYFTATSLRRLVERAGFEVTRSGTAFDGEFLYVEAEPSVRAATPVGDSTDEVQASVDHALAFASGYRSTVRAWQDRLSVTGAPAAGAALWGAGAKGATFLNTVGRDSRIVAVVDVNPRKWGRYVPGTGHIVGAPDDLPAHEVDTVVITNASYRNEIRDRLSELGISADVVCV